MVMPTHSYQYTYIYLFIFQSAIQFSQKEKFENNIPEWERCRRGRAAGKIALPHLLHFHYIIGVSLKWATRSFQCSTKCGMLRERFHDNFSINSWSQLLHVSQNSAYILEEFGGHLQENVDGKFVTFSNQKKAYDRQSLRKREKDSDQRSS